jgi:hypothetical protein
MKHVVVAVLLLVVSVLAGCHQVGGLLTRTASPASGTRPLEDIQSIGDLQTRFQADVGKPRLVLLVSPT